MKVLSPTAVVATAILATSLLSTTPADAVGRKADIVALGDSVPSGAGPCDCGNFVDRYASMVRDSGTRVEVHNLADGGVRTADVLDLIEHRKATLRRATTVLLMVGANDYNEAFAQAGKGKTGVYAPVERTVRRNVTQAVQEIRKLNASATVIVLDYWASMEDGAVARKDYDRQQLAAAAECTTSTNRALAAAARATGARYVSTFTAFKGADGARDDTDLLASDGNHPNAAGHRLIARTVDAVAPQG